MHQIAHRFLEGSMPLNHFSMCAAIFLFLKKMAIIYASLKKYNAPKFQNVSIITCFQKSSVNPLVCDIIIFYMKMAIFSSFFRFSKKLPIVVVRDVCLSSVEIISFRSNSLSNRPIDLKIGMNVRKGVVHVREA